MGRVSGRWTCDCRSASDLARDGSPRTSTFPISSTRVQRRPSTRRMARAGCGQRLSKRADGRRSGRNSTSEVREMQVLLKDQRQDLNAESARNVLCALCVLWVATVAEAQLPAGRSQFENRCGVCHGGDANGGEYAPAIIAQVAARSDAQLATLIREGLPARGMPATPNLTDAEIRELTQYLRTLRPRAGRGGAAPAPVAPADD